MKYDLINTKYDKSGPYGFANHRFANLSKYAVERKLLQSFIKILKNIYGFVYILLTLFTYFFGMQEYNLFVNVQRLYAHCRWSEIWEEQWKRFVQSR